MKSLALLIMTGCAVVAVICLAVRSDIPPQFWLWVLGLAGPVIGILQFALLHIRKLLEYDDRTTRDPFLREGEREKKIRTL